MVSNAQKIDQATMLRDSLNGVGTHQVSIHPGNNPAQIQYMFTEQRLLVRNRDVPTATTALQGFGTVTSQADEPLGGVTTFFLPAAASVHGACDAVDAAVGQPGAAMPDHVIHVTPLSCCPATEPVLPQSTVPVPMATRDPGPPGKIVAVAVVDTGRRPGTEQEHPWLKDGITGEGEGGQTDHYRGHGTFVCGVLRSTAPSTEIEVWGKLFRHGGIVESELAGNLRDAILSGAAIISMSAGGTTKDGLPPIAIEAACQLLGPGKLLVAAAGNDNSPTESFYPAAFASTMDRVVAVGALDDQSPPGIADYSNTGAWVSVYARGTNIVNAFPKAPPYRYEESPKKGNAPDVTFTNGLASWSGTSFATPIVSGLIAVELSKNPRQDPKAAWGAVFASSTPIGATGKRKLP
jgi:subtilisin family serine protease